MTLEQVLQDHGPMLGRIVASYESNHALQEDLMQDVSVAIWRALPRFRGGNLRAYLARIAQNRCITHVASAVRNPPIQTLETETVSGQEDPEDSLRRKQRRNALLAAIRRLPLPQRQVVILALEGFSHSEIAESLGISENNAQVRFFRAKSALKDALAGKGF